MQNAVALGTFDGIHLGHQGVLNLPENYKKTVITFKAPPRCVLTGKVELLLTSEDKNSTLKNMGIDDIISLDFKEVMDISAEDFLLNVYNEIKPSLISCGFNNRFGKDGKGDTKLLGKFCKEKGIIFNCCEPIEFEGETVSSSLIRNLLKTGEIEKANRLLYKPFYFENEVISGFKRGRTIGFPTINQEYPAELVKLKFGVYKTKVCFDGKELEGITNIGLRPTFKTDYPISETYIKGFSGDLYGKRIKIIPLKFIREEEKFSSLEELKIQILKDLNS